MSADDTTEGEHVNNEEDGAEDRPQETGSSLDLHLPSETYSVLPER